MTEKLLPVRIGVIEIKDGEIIGDTQKEAVKSAVENQTKSKTALWVKQRSNLLKPFACL